MDRANTRSNLFCSQRLRTGSLPLSIILCFVHFYLNFSFNCPSDDKYAKVYSSLYIIFPTVLLFILGLLLRTRRSPGLFGTKGCSCRYFLYVTGQAAKAPLIWMLLSMINYRCLACAVMGMDRYTRFYFEEIFQAYFVWVQLAGLAGLLILFILDYAVPQSTCAQKCCVQSWTEDLALEEVEIVLQLKAEEKRKAFLEEILKSDLDQLTHKELCQGAAVSDLVWKYKDIVQKNCVEISAGNTMSELQRLGNI